MVEERYLTLKRLAGPRWAVRARCLIRGLGLPRWGNLRRVRPFSDYFGFDRGTPVDRFYLHRFLDRHRALITGRVLEIQCSAYTERYGHGVVEAHSVDINPAVKPRIVCDLAHSEGFLESDYYDLFLMPNSVPFFQDLKGCLRQALRVVKPGGHVLGSAGVMLPLIPDGPEYWHLTPAGWKELLREVWPDCESSVEGHGNCLVAVAAMLGLALEELDEKELEFCDSRYPVLVTFFCRKRPQAGPSSTPS